MYRHVLTSIILFLLGIFIWRTLILFTDLSSLFSNIETPTELNVNINKDESSINLSKPPNPINKNITNNEAIEETIARLKHDVVVTGTILGMLGQKSALFQIEGMADRLFKINTQLMDGFIIQEITSSYVVLKNQIGNETFTLYVQSGKESLPDSKPEPKTEPELKSISEVPDVYDPQLLINDVQNDIYSSEHPENTAQDQDINLQNKQRPLDGAALENGFSHMVEPHQHDTQQFSDNDETLPDYLTKLPDGSHQRKPLN